MLSVATLLPHSRLPSDNEAQRAGLSICCHTSFLALAEQVKRREAHAVLLDATALREELMERIFPAAQRSGSALFLCVRPGHASLCALADLAARAPIEVILSAHVSVPEILDRMSRLPAASVSARLLHLVAPRVSELSPPVRHDALLTLCAPSRLDVLRGSGFPHPPSSRTVSRALTRAGLVSLSQLRRAAGVALSFDLMSDRSLRLGAIAQRAGLGTERSLCAAFRAILGDSPRRSHAQLAASVAARRIASAVCIRMSAEARNSGDTLSASR
jgi:AraC-like DNA-binding protein